MLPTHERAHTHVRTRPNLPLLWSELIFAIASCKSFEKFAEIWEIFLEIHNKHVLQFDLIPSEKKIVQDLPVSSSASIEISNPAKRYKKTLKTDPVEQTEWDFEKELNLEFGQVENLAGSRDFEKELNLQVEAGANSVVSQNFEKELNLQEQAGPSQSQHKGKKKN
jgi:hypothetical protein